jgi:acetoin utilization deacetylase AcuC-like enzyme
LEKDIFAQHNLDEELLFTKRFTAASKLCSPLTSPTDEDINSPIETIERELLNDYASACNSILGVSQPSVKSCPVTHTLTWTDWELSGVHSKEFLSRLAVIHSELVRETHKHYQSVKEVILSVSSFLNLIQDEVIGRRIIELILSEPRCDLNLHCLSHVEGDNLMDRFLLPASMERANMIYSALINVWTSEGKTAFIAARPPGHHCPSFEDRLIGLSASSNATNASDDKLSGSISGTKLERQICRANGLSEAPREHGMGFCALNGLAVALRRFLQLNNPAFEKANGRSIRVAILDLDIHAGNGTELVFRDSRSVLHISFHRYGWLSSAESGSERVMPGTHYYKDVGGVFGKHAKRPRGEGYSVNITLRKGDGNAEVLSGLEAIALPIMKEFSPDLVLVACGFDGLKLSPVFKRRWGEASCPGMDAEYTPSLFGYTINRVRANVQTKVVAATEGGYDPISVGLAARSVVKGLRGTGISKPPLRTFNADWMSHLNNIFQHQQPFWSSLD